MHMEIVRPGDNLDTLTKEQRIKALRRGVPAYVREADADCRVLMGYYNKIIEKGYWRDLADSEEAYFLEYCKKPKAWFEAIRDQVMGIPEGTTLTVREFQQQQAIALSEQPKTVDASPGGDRKSNHYNHNNNDLPDRPSRQGTDPEYLMARLARDYPEVVEQVKAGEFPSVRAAAVAAGIVKPRLQFTVGPSTTPQAFAGALFERLEPEFLDEFAGAFFERLDPEFLGKLLDANRG
jgi:hypothetical protein